MVSKLKHYWLFSLFLISISCFAQNESTKIAELDLKIKEAASAGNYEKAAELNKVKKLFVCLTNSLF